MVQFNQETGQRIPGLLTIAGANITTISIVVEVEVDPDSPNPVVVRSRIAGTSGGGADCGAGGTGF